MRDELLELARIHRRATMRRNVVATLGVAIPVALAIAGCLALIARRVFGADPGWLGAAFLVLVPALVIAFKAAQRRTPRMQSILAGIDSSSGGSGRLLTRTEIEDSRYDSAVATALLLVPPPPRPDLPGLLRRVVPWAVFAAIPFLLPPSRGISAVPHATVEHALARVEQKLATLEEEVSLEKSGDEGLKAQMDRVRDATVDALADGRVDSALEALDRLEAKVDSAAQRAADAMSRAAETGAAGNASNDPAEANESSEAMARLEAELAAAGLDSAVEEARAELAREAENGPQETHESTPDAGESGQKSQSESSSSGEKSASGESGDSGAQGEPSQPGAQKKQGKAGNPLAAAVARKLAAKAKNLKDAGMLAKIDPALLEKLAKLGSQESKNEEAGDDEIAQVEELDLCDDPSHGPG